MKLIVEVPDPQYTGHESLDNYADSIRVEHVREILEDTYGRQNVKVMIDDRPEGFGL